MAEVGAELISAIGGMLLQALMNALTNTLTTLITNAITNALMSIANAVSGLQGFGRFIYDALSTFARNLSAELSGAVATFLNRTNESLQTAFGIINAQQRLHEILTGQVERAILAVNQNLVLEQQRYERTGAAISALVIGLLSEEPKKAESFMRQFLTTMATYGDKRADYFIENTNLMLHYFHDYIVADLKRVEEMSNEEIAAAANAILETARERSKLIYEWFMEAVVKPISYQQAYTFMLREALALEKEDIKRHMKETQEAYDEWIAEQLQAMLRQVGGG